MERLLYSSATDRLLAFHLFMIISANLLNWTQSVYMTGFLGTNMKRKVQLRVRSLPDGAILCFNSRSITVLTVTLLFTPIMSMMALTCNCMLVSYQQNHNQNFLILQVTISLQIPMVYVCQSVHKSQTSLGKLFHIVTKVTMSFTVLLCLHCSNHGEADWI